MNWKCWQRKPTTGRAYYVVPRILGEAEQRHEDMERLLTLAGVSLTSPILKTLLSYADEHAANEQEMALRPDLPDHVRHFNAGRAASALDFAAALRELHARAQREGRKQA